MNYGPYAGPPPYQGTSYDFRTPPVSPPPPGAQYFSSPRYSVYASTPSPRGKSTAHARRTSLDPSGFPFAYAYGSPRYASYAANARPREPDYVPIYESTPQHAYPPTGGHERTTRARRASHGAGTGTQPRPQSAHQQASPQTPKNKGTPKKEAPKATEEDARRAGIPAGYSLKHWDPTEEPILLLGSVFSPDSIGRWIYDWTVFRFGPATPMADVAGDLWLLLIHLSGKVKRADHIMPRIRREENRDTVEEFLESGDRLLVRFKKLLKICEEYMWRAAKREHGEKKPMSMGRNAGVEFVDTMFGRDRELDKTEKLMSSIRLWSMRFDANVDEILRNPTA